MEGIVYLGILGAFVILFGIAFELYDSGNRNWLVSGIFTFILFILISIIAYNIDDANKPTAIDVYKGNTTLEITYRDSIPIDTIVVYKNK